MEKLSSIVTVDSNTELEKYYLKQTAASLICPFLSIGAIASSLGLSATSYLFQSKSRIPILYHPITLRPVLVANVRNGVFYYPAMCVGFLAVSSISSFFVYFQPYWGTAAAVATALLQSYSTYAAWRYKTQLSLSYFAGTPALRPVKLPSLLAFTCYLALGATLMQCRVSEEEKKVLQNHRVELFLMKFSPLSVQVGFLALRRALHGVFGRKSTEE